MTITVRPKPFNAMARAMKKIVDPDSPKPACRRIHLDAFEIAPGCWKLRATASDSYRVAEDTIRAMDGDGRDGIRSAEINPPRLAAKGPVRIEMLPDRTVVSFDDVSFTTMAADDGSQLSMGSPCDPISAFMSDVKTGIAAKPGRISVTCNAKYLLDAAGSMKDSKTIRIDAGQPTDPVILTGQDEYADIIRVVLPMRSGTDDQEYRARLAETVTPAGKEEQADA